MTSDFNGYPAGGGQPTVEIFLKFARERDFDIKLFGMTTRKDEAVGKWARRRIYGDEYDFMPLGHLAADKYGKRRPRVPDRVVAFLAFLRFKWRVQNMRFDVLYLHEPQALPFFWRKRQPILYHIHGTQESAAEFARYGIARTRMFRAIFAHVVRYLMRRGDRFIAIDEESYELYTRMVPAFASRFHLLPTAIDIDQFRPLPRFDRREWRRQLGLPPDGPMLLFVGRLSWKKGVDRVIRAVQEVSRQIPGAFLAIAGFGEDRNALTHLAEELGISDRVFFLGRIPHLPQPDLPRLYNCADVSIVASYHESLALVITEALACGVPVVSTSVGIAPKVIHDGITGYLLKSGEPEEMAARLLDVLLRDHINSEDCIRAAREYAETSKKICDVLDFMVGPQEQRLVNE